MILPAGCVIGHSEWAPTRKTDIGAYINTVRAQSGSPQNAPSQTGDDGEVFSPEAQKWLHDQIQYAVLAVLKGGGNSVFDGLPAGQRTEVSQVYALLSNGDGADVPPEKDTHPQSVKRTRIELADLAEKVDALTPTPPETPPSV